MQTKRTTENEPVATEAMFLGAWNAHLRTMRGKPWLVRPWLARSRALLQRFTRTYDHLRQQPRHVRRRIQRQWGASLAGAALALALLNAPVYAADITVDGTTCTLVDAITAANTDTATGGCAAGSGADTITLQTDVTLTASDNFGYNDNNGLPIINSEITIEGTGYTISRDAGAPAFRLLAVGSSGNLTLHQTTLSGGNVTNGGGGIVNKGTLTVSNSTLSGNATSIQGGGIENFGTLTVSNSTLSGNTATRGGGIYNNYGTVTVSNSTLSGNTGSDYGGGIYNNGGTLNLAHSLISGNNAGSNGAEIYNYNGTVNAANFNLIGHDSNAGSFNFTPSGSDIVPSQALAAILNTTLTDNGGGTLTHALVTGSPAIDAAGGGGLIATDQRGVSRPQGAADDIGAFEALPTNVSFNGGNCNLGDAIAAANQDRSYGACNPGVAGADTITLLSDITLLTTHNNTSDYLSLPPITSTITIEGAGFMLARDLAATAPFGLLVVQPTGDLTVNDLTLTGAYSKYGAIGNIGQLTLNNSTITGNSGVVLGGGLFNIGVATLNNSSVISNTTLVPAPVPYLGGGGITNWAGTLTLNHSVVSGNSSTTFAGGIQNTKYGTLLVNESNISQNTAGYAGGGIFTYKGTSVTVNNSTISNNDGTAYGGALGSVTTPITVINSTISDNQADSGGGFLIAQNSLLTLANSTVTGNTSTTSGGGIYTDYAMQLTGNLIAGNVSPDGAEITVGSGSPTVARRALLKSTNALTQKLRVQLAKSPFLRRVQALVAARKAAQSKAPRMRGATPNPAATSANLLGHSGLTSSEAFDGFTPDAGDLVATSDGTTPTALTAILNTTLANNGGLTAGVANAPIFTHALVPGSPAIDAAGASGLATDQRGVSRPQGIADDIGAFEMNSEKLNASLTLQGSPATSFNATPDATFGAQSSAGVYTINATFRNTANPAVELHNVYFVVKQLVSINSVDNYLLSADNPPGQVGATQSVPNSAFGSDNVWIQNQDLLATFRIGLMERRRFTFLVDVYGVVANVTPGAVNTGAANGPQMLGHFSFTVDPNVLDGQAHVIFLPMVNK